jgi:hypothetical protein
MTLQYRQGRPGPLCIRNFADSVCGMDGANSSEVASDGSAVSKATMSQRPVRVCSYGSFQLKPTEQFPQNIPFCLLSGEINSLEKEAHWEASQRPAGPCLHQDVEQNQGPHGLTFFLVAMHDCAHYAVWMRKPRNLDQSGRVRIRNVMREPVRAVQEAPSSRMNTEFSAITEGVYCHNQLG